METDKYLAKNVKKIIFLETFFSFSTGAAFANTVEKTKAVYVIKQPFEMMMISTEKEMEETFNFTSLDINNKCMK